MLCMGLGHAQTFPLLGNPLFLSQFHDFRLDIRKYSSLKEQCCSGTAAQGGGGVTIPGGVQGPWGCGTEGCGQWTWWGVLGLGLGILVVFSNLNGSLNL